MSMNKALGQEWCQPDQESIDDGKHLSDLVYVNNGKDFAILCNVIQDINTGTITRLPVKYSDLPFTSIGW